MFSFFGPNRIFDSAFFVAQTILSACDAFDLAAIYFRKTAQARLPVLPESS